jgi:large subunit ribosomal protein L6
MVTGVTTGFTKNMEMVGTGYRASVSGKELTLNVGYNKPRVLQIPAGVTVKVGGVIRVGALDKSSWGAGQ